MDQIKLLVKDILYKIQDIPDVALPSVRMSQVKSNSSLIATTSRSISEHNENNNPVTENGNNNNNDGKDEENDVAESFPKSEESEKLDNITTGSKDSICSAPLSPTAGKTRRPKIVMGKRALLRDQQRSQSNLIHQLVNDKYEDQLTHCINRIYHRRVSRDSTDDDGASSNYSAGSLRTINTPEDLYDGRSYFSLLFPTRSDNEFDFLQSTDDLNKDTSVEETFLDSTVISTDLDYDPNKFLKNALGDLSFETQSLDGGFHSTKLNTSANMDTTNVSSIFSKAGSLYSSMRKSIRRACSFRDKHPDARNKKGGKPRCQSYTADGDAVGGEENLMRELFVQNGIIFQASKALSFCKNSGDYGSPECIEAEKILLVASCTKEEIQLAIDNVEYYGKNDNTDKYSGTLEISDIVYYLKGDAVTEMCPKKDYIEYFVVIIHSGKTVLSSKVLTADKNGEVKANKTFVLTDLCTNFNASVAVYSMKVGQVDNAGEDTKLHHKKERKSRKPCPSPRSFFNLHHSSSRRNLYISEGGFTIKPSSFTLWGVCDIRCSDRDKTHFRMHHVPLCSTLEGYFTAVLETSVVLKNKSNGFITIGTEEKSHLVWNRRWCLLVGSLLEYWNYPSEESSSADPIGAIDLKNVLEEASPADRSLCPRPKTLLLIVKNNGEVIHYFLSFDTLEDKEHWYNDINFVIETLRSWGQLHSQISTSV
ncbi:anillin-like isoform X3 [Sitophilus oryzae]|uniref:Anillin-like isoform X3 n=2 Tax=Sitophilus oryzae TaxID=7048 RepID=A0A6J2YA36_SITOR|nr:anillin-like isoform X3 [Sitophilus oryzae]